MCNNWLNALLNNTAQRLGQWPTQDAQRKTIPWLSNKIEAAGAALYFEEGDKYQVQTAVASFFPVSIERLTIEEPQKIYYGSNAAVIEAFSLAAAAECILYLPLLQEGETAGFFLAVWQERAKRTPIRDVLDQTDWQLAWPLSRLLLASFQVSRLQNDWTAFYYHSQQKQMERQMQSALSLDGSDHVLLSILLQLNLLQQSTDLEYIHGRLAGLAYITEQALAEERQIKHKMFPHLLDRVGIKAYIETYARKYGRQTGLEISCRCQLQDNPLPLKTEMLLSTAVQDGLEVASQREQVNHVTVSLNLKGQRLFLQISDDGIGDASADCLRGIEAQVHAEGGKFWLSYDGEQHLSQNILFTLA